MFCLPFSTISAVGVCRRYENFTHYSFDCGDGRSSDIRLFFHIQSNVSSWTEIEIKAKNISEYSNTGLRGFARFFTNDSRGSTRIRCRVHYSDPAEKFSLSKNQNAQSLYLRSIPRINHNVKIIVSHHRGVNTVIKSDINNKT